MKVKKKGKVSSSLSPSSSSSYKDPHKVLKLLPLTILALATALPVPDQQVIAYMITRSIFPTAATNPSSYANKCKKKPNQKDPLLECGCFDCYTSFWHRWDSSPNSDLIHQVIEAFEDHLLQKESPKKHYKQRKRKDKVAVDRFESKNTENEVANIELSGDGIEGEEEKVVAVQLVQPPLMSSHKGLARKVLLDVMGLLNSRLWSLWSPSF
ncbi:hypothetical protein ACOSP7_000121 [Xanthoceras sorbifolium]